MSHMSLINYTNFLFVFFLFLNFFKHILALFIIYFYKIDPRHDMGNSTSVKREGSETRPGWNWTSGVAQVVEYMAGFWLKIK